MDFKQIYKYTKDLNILYVEDDECLMQETGEILKTLFFSTDTALNGQIALEKYKNYFKKNNTYYDLVITDIMMPIMDGETLIRKIDFLNTNQPVIVISAFNDSSRLINLIQKGIDGFILKPISSLQFIETLQKTCKSISAQKKLSLYQKELEQKVQCQAKEIIYTQRISIEAIANMVEGYDDETGMHVKRIEKFTALLVNSYPLDVNCSVELKELAPFASLLHDIGKIAIPKDILNKPDKLTDNEFEIVKRHSQLGGDMLEKANNTFKKQFGKDSYLHIASNIAMYHHEKYNGKGYPKGLKGEEIPLCARVVAIADVYDALRSKRVYKESFSHKKAVEIIKQESGESFDPKMVEIFLSIKDKFEEVFHKYNDLK